MPVMSLPQKWTLPAEGRTAPVIRLNSVVLPAPFGPMKPQICRSGMSKLTSFNAATPPKNFVSVWTSRIFTFTPKPTLQQPHGPAHQSHQTIGFEQNDQHQQGPVQEQVDIGKADDELLFHDAKDDSSQDRAPDSPNTADHGHQQDGNTGLKSKFTP